MLLVDEIGFAGMHVPIKQNYMYVHYDAGETKNTEIGKLGQIATSESQQRQMPSCM